MSTKLGGELIDWMRGELDADAQSRIDALLAEQSEAGAAARRQVAVLRKLFASIPSHPRAEQSGALEASIAASLPNVTDAKARDFAIGLAAKTSKRVSLPLLRRIDASIAAASVSEDSPMIHAALRVLVEDAPDAEARAANILSTIPGLAGESGRLKEVLASFRSIRIPGESAAARRISNRLRRALQLASQSDRMRAVGAEALALPSVSVSAALEARIRASITSESAAERRPVAPVLSLTDRRRKWLRGAVEWRLARGRSVAAAVLLHGVVLGSLLLTAKPIGSLPDVPITAAAFTRDWSPPVAEEGEIPSTPDRIRAVAARPTLPPGPITAELPFADSALGDLIDATDEFRLGGDLVRPMAAGPVRPMVTSSREAFLPTRGAIRPSLTAEGERLYSMRGLARDERAVWLSDNLQWFMRLDEMLSYLVRAQLPDGSWGGGVTSEVPNIEILGPWDPVARKVENSALALLALSGEGYSTLNDTPRETVRRGIEWLVAQQNSVGGFVSVTQDGVAVAQDVAVTDAICALALAEAYALGGGIEIRESMRRALRRVLSTQLGAEHGRAPASESDRGGFPAGSTGHADPVATLWAIQALKAGQAVKWREPGLEAAMDAIEAWVIRQSASDGGVLRDGYQGVTSRSGSAGRADPAVRQTGARSVASGTAALLASAKLLGIDTGTVAASQSEFLRRSEYAPSFEPFGPLGQRFHPTNFLGWSTTALAYAQDGLEGAEKTWFAGLGVALFSRGDIYATGGGHLGSFSPIGEEERLRGRVYTAAMGALSIENVWRWRTP